MTRTVGPFVVTFPAVLDEQERTTGLLREGADDASEVTARCMLATMAPHDQKVEALLLGV